MSREVIRQNYQEFCKAEGNQHIASEYAIEKLASLIANFGGKKILEVGLGIGSIAGILLRVFQNLEYYGTENNSFCLEALKQNLSDSYDQLHIYGNLDDLEEIYKFDLVIIDGTDKDLHKIAKMTASNGIIAIEGDRKVQIDLVKSLFPQHLFVHSISKRRNRFASPFSSKHWQGGIKIIFIKPTFQQRLWWIKEKTLTKFKYFYRSIDEE